MCVKVLDSNSIIDDSGTLWKISSLCIDRNKLPKKYTSIQLNGAEYATNCNTMYCYKINDVC